MLKRLMTLFQGYDKAHGRYEVRHVTEKGKMEGKASTKKGGATEAEWTAHLSGKGVGLGIIPLLSDNTLTWGCIDVDVYPLDLAELETSIKAKGLPLVMCRSKSGGAHLFLFLKEPEPAIDAQALLGEWAALLGYGGSEIFPKQTMRADHEKDIGNWLNMPYYNTQKTNRYCVRDGQPVALEAFIKHAEAKAISLQEWETAVENKDKKGLFEDAPPCLQHIYNAGGFGEGSRNDGMFSIGVYLRKRYPDDWQDKLQIYNVEMCDPIIPTTELQNLVRSLGKKEYEYRCKQAPLKDFCNRRVCLRRQFGVGDVAGNSVEISNIAKFEGDPIIWFVEIGSQRIQMSTAELQYQTRFHKVCIEKLNIFPDEVPKRRWSRYIHEKLQSADIYDAPEEGATLQGQFNVLLDMFLNGVGQLVDKDELTTRFAPFRPGDGTVWFRLKGLTDFLESHSYRFPSTHHVCHQLKERGGHTDFKNIKSKGFNVWVLEDSIPQEDGALPDFAKEEF